ncbi:MAG: DUF1294 domain-containing protein [Ruminococcaceae bacterium]|nr:DUF1294 domain-containing protein [Oscillospiraceae bacterium]
MKTFLIYLLAISAVSVLVCVYDKFASKHSMQRISERALLLFSVFGGSAAMYITMCIIRHKTKHNKFMWGLPLIILVQTAILLLIMQEFL